MAENAEFYRQEEAVSQVALIRASKVDKLFVVLLALAWTTTCIVIGLVVGIASSNAELGVAVGAASLAVVAFIAFIIGAQL